jgi:hypothetical protein
MLCKGLGLQKNDGLVIRFVSKMSRDSHTRQSITPFMALRSAICFLVSRDGDSEADLMFVLYIQLNSLEQLRSHMLLHLPLV